MKAPRKWFVVRTNIKCEDRATKSLRAARYRVYVPVMKKTIIHHRTKQPINRRFKLFNRYIFVSMAADNLDFGNVRACDGVEAILGIEGKPYEVSRQDVAHFMMAQRRGEFDSLQPLTKKQLAHKYPVGSLLKIHKDHPFGGFYGQVEKVKGKSVVRVALQLFGRLVSVDVHKRDIDTVYRDNDLDDVKMVA